MDKEFQLIESYLANELSEEAQTRFEERCQTDEQFAEAFQRHKQAKELIRFAARKQEKERLMKMGKELLRDMPKQESSSPKKKRPYLQYAAGIAAVIALVVLIAQFALRPDPKELYAEIYDTPSFSIETRAEDGVGELWKKAESAYEQEEFAQAADYFEQLTAGEEKAATARFYWAICLIEQNKAEEAVPLLEQNIESKSSESQRSEWMLALVYLKLGDRAKAKQILKQIDEAGPHDHGMDAHKLLQIL